MCFFPGWLFLPVVCGSLESVSVFFLCLEFRFVFFLHPEWQKMREWKKIGKWENGKNGKMGKWKKWENGKMGKKEKNGKMGVT
jgi:hypothetical protein